MRGFTPRLGCAVVLGCTELRGRRSRPIVSPVSPEVFGWRNGLLRCRAWAECLALRRDCWPLNKKEHIACRGRSPQRDRVQKVGRIGSLLCTLTLVLIAGVAVIVSGVMCFKPNDPQTLELRGLFDSAGIRHPVVVALFLLTLATWVYALCILRRLFLEFSLGIVFSVRNARAICWLGVSTIFEMFSFNASDSEVQEAMKGLSKTEASAEIFAVKVSGNVKDRTPRVGFGMKVTVTSAGEETPLESSLFEKFTVGFDVEYLLVGLLLLAAGWGLEQGVVLQEEQNLII
jgi:hypothetical protein